MPPSDQPIANVWALISLICTHLLNLMPPEDSGDNCLYRTYDSGLPSTFISRSGASPCIKSLPSGANITSQKAAPPPAPPSKSPVMTLPMSRYDCQQMKRLRRTIYQPLPPPNAYHQSLSSQPQSLQMWARSRKWRVPVRSGILQKAEGQVICEQSRGPLYLCNRKQNQPGS